MRPFRIALLSVAVLGGACRKTDFTEAPQPEAGTVLLLRAATSGDTARVALTLEGSVPLSLGSVTGDVGYAAGWTFIGCDAATPNAEGLVACKAHDRTVRVAGAWAAGTAHGALVRLLFVRSSAAVSGEHWELSVREMITARGEPVKEGELRVRRESGK
ncbi:hypothetical protein [Gemmatimonas sp.]|jgi:hypothetical protein|uniref:hypothetical protein n=1 Tax=Gemmatimonas sp. TaxID=1962908 RepID=UPI0037BF19E7